MKVIDEYLNELNDQQKIGLQRVRDIVIKTVPDAKEVISYGMPGFKYYNKYLIGFAAFKNHMSIFPASKPVAVLKEKLKDFKLSKGTIQFTNEKPIPEDIIKQLLDIRVADISK